MPYMDPMGIWSSFQNPSPPFLFNRFLVESRWNPEKRSARISQSFYIVCPYITAKEMVRFLSSKMIHELVFEMMCLDAGICRYILHQLKESIQLVRHPLISGTCLVVSSSPFLAKNEKMLECKVIHSICKRSIPSLKKTFLDMADSPCIYIVIEPQPEIHSPPIVRVFPLSNSSITELS